MPQNHFISSRETRPESGGAAAPGRRKKQIREFINMRVHGCKRGGGRLTIEPRIEVGGGHRRRCRGGCFSGGG